MYLLNIYKPSTDPKVDKTGLQNIWSSSSGNAVVKTGLLNLYRLSTGIAVVRTVVTILYRLSNSFVVDLKKIYRCSSSFAVVKNGFSNFYRICYTKKWIAKSLQGSNKICGCKNVHTEHLQAKPTSFAVVINGSAYTVLQEDKTGLANLCRASTGFAGVKMYLLNIH